MSSLFFTEYIKSNIFMHKLNEKIEEHDLYFDLILSDISYDDCHIRHIFSNNKSDNVSLLDGWIDAIETSHHTLIILNQLNVDYIQPIINNFKADGNYKISIINLFTGLGSMGHKIKLENSDLEFISDKFSVYEPIDLENVWNILQKGENQYIRLSHRELPEAIFDVDELGIIDSSMLENLDTISLKGYGFGGNNGTIFVCGSLFSLAIQTGEILQDLGKDYSFYIFQKLNSDWTEEMIKSVFNTKKLYVLIDHDNTEGLKKYFENKLKSLNLENVEIKLLTPEYDTLTTIFNEYQDEQSGMDPENLVNRIIK